MHIRIEQFIREYLVDLNGAAAARRCGYPARRAVYRGSKLLARKDVQAAVKAAMAARAERTQITADRVLKEYARIAFADLRKVADWGEKGLVLRAPAAISDDDAAAIAWVSTGGRKGTHAQRVRLHDKQRALDALARHLGLAKDPRATYDLRPYDPAARAALADSAKEKLRRKLDEMAARENGGSTDDG